MQTPFKTINGAPYETIWYRSKGARTVPPDTIQAGDWIEYWAGGGCYTAQVTKIAAVYTVQLDKLKPASVKRERVRAVYRTANTSRNMLDILMQKHEHLHL